MQCNCARSVCSSSSAYRSRSFVSDATLDVPCVCMRAYMWPKPYCTKMYAHGYLCGIARSLATLISVCLHILRVCYIYIYISSERECIIFHFNCINKRTVNNLTYTIYPKQFLYFSIAPCDHHYCDYNFAREISFDCFLC